MTLQSHDHHDIIIYLLINKEFLIKKFSHQLTPISFCLFDHNTYNSVSQKFAEFPLSFHKFYPNFLLFKIIPDDVL